MNYRQEVICRIVGTAERRSMLPSADSRNGLRVTEFRRTQNSSEVLLLHSTRRREDGKGKVGERRQRFCLSVFCVIKKTKISFNFDSQWHSDTALLQLKRNRFTSGSTDRD
jgi:hypothetical protein